MSPGAERGRVVVGEVGVHDLVRLPVERLADPEVRGVIARLPDAALVAGPAEVAEARVGEPVDLLGGVPTDIADPDVAARGEVEAERIAQAFGDDPARVRVGAGEHRVGADALAGARVDADQRPVEAHRIPRRPQVLAAQCAALGVRRRRVGAGVRVVAWVHRIPVLAPVGEVERGAVAARRIEGARGVHLQRADRVARVLLAPVLDQDVLVHAPTRLGNQAREPAAHDAAVARRPRRVRAGVGEVVARRPARRRAPDCRVVGVEDVDVRKARVVEVDVHPEQTAIPVVVDVGPQVREQGLGGVAEPVVGPDAAALLGDVDGAVGREADHGRGRDSGEGLGLLEAGGQVPGTGRRRDQQRQQGAGHRRGQRPRPDPRSFSPRCINFPGASIGPF